MAAPPTSLSKTKFTHGKQCAKRLWLTVHEPDAPELVPTVQLQAIFDQGHQVGALAQTFFPGGVLMEEHTRDKRRWVQETAAAMRSCPVAIFEAAFESNGAFGAVDVLERLPGGWGIVEVKSTLEVKENYIDDVALQLYALRGAGVNVQRVEVMFLNRDAVAPDRSDLFRREDVTARAEALQASTPDQVRRLRDVLAGPQPEVKAGSQCSHPYRCPFEGRCAPELPEHHVSTLHNVRNKGEAYLKRGYTTLDQIPPEDLKSDVMARQVRAVQSGALLVEPTLRATLEGWEGKRVAFLDFETINPAIPQWAGVHPLEHTPVQFSCHVVQPSGEVRHEEFLAEPGSDPRPALADALLRAVAGADVVVAYNDSFEKRAIDHLAAAVPDSAQALAQLRERVTDLLPVVKGHVYHPDFGGSFSLKTVAPVLAGLSYADLDVGEGATAAVLLEKMLLRQGPNDPMTRYNLRTYCAQDTAALVALHERLRGLSGLAPRALTMPAAEAPPLVRTVVLAENVEACAKAMRGRAEFDGAHAIAVGMRASDEEVRDACRSLATFRDRLAADGPLRVVASFPSSAEGARISGRVVQVLPEGVRYERLERPREVARGGPALG